MKTKKKGLFAGESNIKYAKKEIVQVIVLHIQYIYILVHTSKQIINYNILTSN